MYFSKYNLPLPSVRLVLSSDGIFHITPANNLAYER